MKIKVFYEDEKSYTRIKKFLFNEEDTYVNGIWRTEKLNNLVLKIQFLLLVA